MTSRAEPQTPLRLGKMSRLRDLPAAVALSPWTPLTTAILAAGLILGLSATVLVQTRLWEMRAEARMASSTAMEIAAPRIDADFMLEPNALRPISEDEARLWNAALPFSTLPVLAARPFIMAPDKAVDYARALECLTTAVYYEAASETALGQAAVAQVVINRMRHPAFPKTICGVVFQGQERATGCQFSFTCDGAMARNPSAAGWARARAAASAALNGHVTPEVGMATHYHTDWVAPYWAERLVKMRQIGAHIFYRWSGGWGLPAAFGGVHAGSEPLIARLGSVVFEAEDVQAPVESDLVQTRDVMPEPLAIRQEREAPVEEIAQPLNPSPLVESEALAVASPPPAVLASPLDGHRRGEPARRSRIAVPR
jgi:hypothetical protein